VSNRPDPWAANEMHCATIHTEWHRCSLSGRARTCCGAITVALHAEQAPAAKAANTEAHRSTFLKKRSVSTVFDEVEGRFLGRPGR
jgi:hypothetical protein